MGLLFWRTGTPTFWLGLLLFTKRESRTPTFKILVRTLCVFFVQHDKWTELSYTKVSDKMAYPNSAYPDQTAPEGAV